MSFLKKEGVKQTVPEIFTVSIGDNWAGISTFTQNVLDIRLYIIMPHMYCRVFEFATGLYLNLQACCIPSEPP